MQRKLGAQISHMLKDRGVEVIFGIPGVHNQEMYRGIEESGLTHILARHEQGAGFMADGYARATGRPGVCYVISGPGLTNIMTPMGQGYSDSVPMLVLSSVLDETSARRGQLHQMKDQEGAARCVADWSETARTADAAYRLIDRALLTLGTAGTRRRPIHIQTPIHLLESLATTAPALPTVTSTVMAGNDSGVADKLAKAKRPLFVFGGGVVRQGADRMSDTADWAYKVVAKTKAASFTTYAGRGIIPADAPFHFGAFLARGASADIIASADLVIAVGTALSEVDLWRDNLGNRAELIRVDLDPEVLATPGQTPVRQDCHTFLPALFAALPDDMKTSWTAAEVADFKHKMRAEIAAERPGIIPVADSLREALPADTMIYSDMTQFAYAAKEIWPMDRPGHWHHPYGFGTLGYALPAAIGGAIGRPDKPTIAIAGDYGFQYTIQELATAVELGLPLPIILWDNGKLGEIEDSMVRAQIAPNAVIQRNPDFGLLAQAYGAATAAPKTLAEMQDAVRTALKADRPTLIHVKSDIALG